MNLRDPKGTFVGQNFVINVQDLLPPIGVMEGLLPSWSWFYARPAKNTNGLCVAEIKESTLSVASRDAYVAHFWEISTLWVDVESE